MRSGQLAWPPHTHRGAHGSAHPGHRPGLPSGLPLCDPSVSRPGLCSSRSLHAATCHCACPQWTPPDLCTLHCIPAAGVPPHWLSWPPHCWATQHTEDRGVLLGFPPPWPSPCPPALALLANPLCLSWALATGPVTQNLALSTPGQAESWHRCPPRRPGSDVRTWAVDQPVESRIHSAAPWPLGGGFLGLQCGRRGRSTPLIRKVQAGNCLYSRWPATSS